MPTSPRAARQRSHLKRPSQAVASKPSSMDPRLLRHRSGPSQEAAR